MHQNIGIRFKGIAVMIDDGCRGREADTYILMTKLAHIPAAIHIFGDTEQGLPVHISSIDKSFNEFVNRSQKSLMKRLLQQGFPNITLLRQYRMHYKLLAFPKKRFYNDELFSVGSANVYIKPKVADCLKEILELEKPDTEYIRLLYVKVANAKLRYTSSPPSRVNLETLEWVLGAVRKLNSVFGKDTQAKVLMITPYHRQATEYRKAMYDERRRDNERVGIIDYAQFASVCTVEEARGYEAEIVILGLVDVRADRVDDFSGMADEDKAYLAVARATKVLWIIGGRFEGYSARLRELRHAVLEYKRMICRTGSCIPVKAPRPTRPIPHDLATPGELREANLVDRLRDTRRRVRLR